MRAKEGPGRKGTWWKQQVRRALGYYSLGRGRAYSGQPPNMDIMLTDLGEVSGNIFWNLLGGNGEKGGGGDAFRGGDWAAGGGWEAGLRRDGA